jgi:hypothetical protein
MNEKPIPESYWVQPGQFLAGGYPALRFNISGTRKRLSAFLGEGFDVFIDLTCEGERDPYLALLRELDPIGARQILHWRFSFPDFGVPPHDEMVAALDTIDSSLAEGRKVYLHCVGGIGRTGTTVGCYFVRHGMQPVQALLHMRTLYTSAAQSLFASHSPESTEQINFILNWVEHGLA